MNPTKSDFERFIVNFNEIITVEQTDDYRTKQHLIDRWDSFCESWIKAFDLHIENQDYLRRKDKHVEAKKKTD